MVLVDDCSPDESWAVMKSLKPTYPELKLARLSRNSGQHDALLCGFSLAKGDLVVTMDDDLEHRPEEIPKLVDAVERGYDLVIADASQSRNRFMGGVGGNVVDGILRHVFELPSGFALTSFRAVRRHVIDGALEMGGSFPYITAMLLANSSKRANVKVAPGERQYGKSNYTFFRSTHLALNLIFSYSVYPVYFVMLLCLVAVSMAVFLAGVAIYNTIVYGAYVPGWASLMSVVSLLNGLVLLSLVILGAYISRLYRHVIFGRGRYRIREIDE